MLHHLAAWYSRRVVNVNVNIIMAGVLALGPVLVVVRFAEYLLSTGLKAHQTLQTHHQLIISGLTFLADVIFDVAIYYCLHWFANHAPAIIAARKKTIEAVAEASRDHVPFLKDATKVQLQRAVLSPLLYFLWLGTQFALMKSAGLSAVWATVGGFVVAISVVRTMHTFWMLKEERRLCSIREGRVCGKCGYDLRAVPCEVSGVCPECGKGFMRSAVVPPGVAASASPGGNGHAQSLSEKGLKSVSRS